MLASAQMFRDTVMRAAAAAMALSFAAPIVSPWPIDALPPIAVAAGFQRAEMVRVARAPSRVRDLPLPEPVAEDSAIPSAPEATLAWPEAAAAPAAVLEEPPTAGGL